MTAMLAGTAALAALLLLAVLAAGFTDTFGPYYSDGGETIGPPALAPQVTGDTRVQTTFTIAAAGADQEQQFGFDVANMKGLLITVTGNTGGTVVLETNSTSSPGTTLTFPAGGGELLWSNRSPLANPFGSTDVTTTFWSNNGTGEASVRVRALLNS
jgi:hypothetical protein